MPANLDRHDHPASDQLHPVVYKAIIALGVWLVLSFWGFDGGGRTGLVLAVASAFVVIAVALPAALWLVTRKARPSVGADRHAPASFMQWIAGEFEAHRARIKGSEALIEVLLPIAAVSLGMTIFAIVLHFSVPGHA